MESHQVWPFLFGGALGAYMAIGFLASLFTWDSPYEKLIGKLGPGIPILVLFIISPYLYYRGWIDQAVALQIGMFVIAGPAILLISFAYLVGRSVREIRQGG